jgi:hypothetical protein
MIKDVLLTLGPYYLIVMQMDSAIIWYDMENAKRGCDCKCIGFIIQTIQMLSSIQFSIKVYSSNYVPRPINQLILVALRFMLWRHFSITHRASDGMCIMLMNALMDCGACLGSVLGA